MIVGVPREIKTEEHRVAITPIGVRELTDRGHRVLVERGAGDGSTIHDAEYEAQGAVIVDNAQAVFDDAEMVLKVKEPQPVEVDMFHEGQILFTYLHLAAYPALAAGLAGRGIIAIAYETVQMPDRSLPLLAPMSEIAGRMATQAGAYFLEKPQGGRGILLGGVTGVAPGKVVVIGGGIAGSNAAAIAIGMQAEVVVLDTDLNKLRWLDSLYQGRAVTLNSQPVDVGGAGGERGSRHRDGSRPGGVGTEAGHRGDGQVDEARRRAGRRGDRPGRVLRDIAGDDPFRPGVRGPRCAALRGGQHPRRRAPHLDLCADQCDPSLRRDDGRRRGRDGSGPSSRS